MNENSVARGRFAFILTGVRFTASIFLIVILCASGCGRFAARRMVQSPNTYPKWLAPKAPVTLAFSNQLLSTFTNQYLRIPSPEARIRYRVFEPANYEFRWTNHLDEAQGRLDLSFGAKVDHLSERTNQWSNDPRGTVVLLHGYGVSGFAMLPWAFYLAQEGWRCVLVDLRGHGRSTGKRIYFGTQEVRDLEALLDQLSQNHQVNRPVAVVGHSYGAVLALRWKKEDARIEKVVAMSPYADLSRAALNIRRQYARWIPETFVKAGLNKLPALLHVSPNDLNPECWVALDHETTLFIAGSADRIAPVDQVQLLWHLAGTDNKFLVVPNAAHEPLPFYLDKLAGPVTRWLTAPSLAAGPKRDNAPGGL